jgi:hypothetical protein
MEDDGEGKSSAIRIASWKKFAVVSLARRQAEVRAQEEGRPDRATRIPCIDTPAAVREQSHSTGSMHLSIASTVTYPPTGGASTYL